MTDPAIEAMARAIMIARPNGGCIVQDWEKEAHDNPHVETALKQAQAAYAALEAAGFAVVPVEPTNGMLGEGWEETPCGWQGTWEDLLRVYRAMIAAAKPNTDAREDG